MLTSGFTILRNAVKFQYPFLESIRSVLPICDEFVINVGDSEDNTLQLVQSFAQMWPQKIRVIQNAWDMSLGKEVLSQQTNAALAACRGEWAFYLQSDEVIHEQDLPRLKALMEKYRRDPAVDAFRFSWLHFYGSYFRYRIDRGWYQKQQRIIRNNGTIESYGDAYAFRRKDGKDLCWKHTRCLLYHYGWVHTPDMMTRRRVNAEEIGYTELKGEERAAEYAYGDLSRFPPYFGTHPQVMAERVREHDLSRQDKEAIGRRYWWHPMRWLNVRYKTGRRVKERIE